jgi:hypothetical protein
MKTKKPFNYEFWSGFVDIVYKVVIILFVLYCLWLYEVVVVGINIMFDKTYFGKVGEDVKFLWKLLTSFLE